MASRTSAGTSAASTYSARRPADLDGDLVGELLELLGPGDEVGLAVDLDEDADPATGVDVALNEPLAGFPPGPLGRLGLAAGAEQRHRRLHVATGLLEGALAVHEARPGHLPQCLHRGR